MQEHRPVLLKESIDALVTSSSGVYVDGTFGRGGHTRALLERLDREARVIAIDKDPQALAHARALAASEPRLDIHHGSFAELPALLADRRLEGVTGVLLDLGVSSPQLDDPRRGFSFQSPGPLDMRMDSTRGETAAEWLASVSQDELTTVLREYGEERFARRIAGAIIRVRAQRPIEDTAELARIASEANPRWEKHKHPATRTFQAIRIRVNRELEDLERFLGALADVLLPGGRAVIISFHSLEDRLVKRALRDLVRGPVLPRGLPVRAESGAPRWRAPGRGIRAGATELAANPRARSATLRVAERLA